MTFVLHFMYICSTNDYDCMTIVIQNNKVMKKEGKRMYSYRVPESLYDEIDRMVKLRINEYERELLTGEKKSNPADDVYNGFPTRIGMTSQDESSVISTEQKNKLLEATVPKKIEPQVAEDKIEYDILESFPFGIEKIEDYGKNKSLYFCEPDYYTRVVNEKAKHISYESAVNYLKSK